MYKNSSKALRNQCQRRGGSSPFIRTNDVSIRTNRTELIQNQSENKIWLFFLCEKKYKNLLLRRVQKV